jgi:hypothetical protein
METVRRDYRTLGLQLAGRVLAGWLGYWLEESASTVHNSEFFFNFQIEITVLIIA